MCYQQKLAGHTRGINDQQQQCEGILARHSWPQEMVDSLCHPGHGDGEEWRNGSSKAGLCHQPIDGRLHKLRDGAGVLISRVTA